MQDCANPVLRLEGLTMLLFQKTFNTDQQENHNSTLTQQNLETDTYIPSQAHKPLDEISQMVVSKIDKRPAPGLSSILRQLKLQAEQAEDSNFVLEESEEELKRREQIEKKRKLQDQKKSKKKIDPKKIKLLM